MKTEEILTALRRLKVETGSLVCMGCGREHNCGIHGCQIVREAAELIEKLTGRCARYAEEIADPQGIKEKVAMDFEKYGGVRVVKVERVEEYQQMTMEGDLHAEN